MTANDQDFNATIIDFNESISDIDALIDQLPTNLEYFEAAIMALNIKYGHTIIMPALAASLCRVAMDRYHDRKLLRDITGPRNGDGAPSDPSIHDAIAASDSRKLYLMRMFVFDMMQAWLGRRQRNDYLFDADDALELSLLMTATECRDFVANPVAEVIRKYINELPQEEKFHVLLGLHKNHKGLFSELFEGN